MHDLVIRGGRIIDGTGRDAFFGDVGISGQKISVVGPNAGPGKSEIDATGLIVTPGFIDVHTHYDGQAMWDPVLAPSSWHGVTSVVMGLCGVGFAPAARDQHSWLIDVMECVEDIPREVLEKSLSWNWESFPEYLDALNALPRVVDVGVHVPHVPLRGYVMGDRAVRNEPATKTDIESMRRIVEEGLRAGALGFSCSRTQFHRMANGELVPASFGDRDEIGGICQAVKSAGHGVIQILSDLNPSAEEFQFLEELSICSCAPVAFTLVQTPFTEEDWRGQLRRAEAATSHGARLVPHFMPRGAGFIMGWQCGVHPFVSRASWCAIEHLSWSDKLAKLKDPVFRARLLSEPNQPVPQLAPQMMELVNHSFGLQYELGDVPDYEPDPETMSIESRARRDGKDPAALAFDILMQSDGGGLIYLPVVNYQTGNLDHVRDLIMHPQTVVSLGDGGAHASLIVDATQTTFLLIHWARDRSRGKTVPLEIAVRSCTHDTAASYALDDRGVIAPGYLADLNVIDFNRLKLLRPYVAFDLPTGARRLLQRAEGYVATVKRGEVTFRDGEHTGAFPGRLIRGPQPAPISQLAAAG
jgi:N-acyl-D-amino-acid deacylase